MDWRHPRNMPATIRRRRVEAALGVGRRPWGNVSRNWLSSGSLARRVVLFHADYLRYVWCCLVASEDGG